MTRPDFFILGAAKSGTTSLYRWLKEHPQVFMPEVKEPSFFSPSFHIVEESADYTRLFDGARRSQRVGEASHTYMSDPETADILARELPHAQFIVLLRNPADRGYSLYHHMRRHGLEPAASFERALEIEEVRSAG